MADAREQPDPQGYAPCSRDTREKRQYLPPLGAGIFLFVIFTKYIAISLCKCYNF